jgi:amidophosphoribosyltransferase
VRQRLGEELARESGFVSRFESGSLKRIADGSGLESGFLKRIAGGSGLKSEFGEKEVDENGLGNGLARRIADVVIPVPDSSIPAAIGFSRASGIPYNDGFVKNRYVGRTFIEPTDSLRKRGVGMKFNVINENVLGKRVVVIDDSIVRGNTTGPLIRLLKQAGAKEVHMCITCPPITHPCFMGVDMGTFDDLIAHKRSVDEIREMVGADSLTYLSLEGMMRAVGRRDGYCQACFTGLYPVSVDLSSAKTGFEWGTK